MGVAALVALAAVASQCVLSGLEIDHNNKGTNKNWQNTTMRVVSIFVTLFVVCSLLINVAPTAVLDPSAVAGRGPYEFARYTDMPKDILGEVSGPGGVGMGSSYAGIDI